MITGSSRTRQPWGSVVFTALVLAALGAPGCSREGADGEAPRQDPAARHAGYRVIDLKGLGQGAETTLTVAVWYPTAAEPGDFRYGGPTSGKVAVDAPVLAGGGPWPLLVFSHGYGGSGLGCVFLAEALARRGWIVAAPDHNDRHSAVRIRGGAQKDFDRRGLLEHAREIAGSGPADRGRCLYRLDEMQRALDGVLASEPFAGAVDRGRIAVGGHSFGGFTALGLCGTIPERRDRRVKGVLLFSTGAGGYLFTAEELAAVKMPAMLFLGEREREQRRGERSMTALAEKIYSAFPPPKYFLEVKGAGHGSFNNRFADTLGARLLSGSEEEFEVIRKYSIAFLEKHVAGRAGADGILAGQDPLLTRYELDGRPAAEPR